MTDTAPSARGMITKIWALCNVLRGDGVSYHQYISELTYLLFLKIAKENNAEELLPAGYRWDDLRLYSGENLLGHYQELLTHLGASAESKVVREIYAFPTTVFSHSENLRVVIDGIDNLNWHSVRKDSIGDIYEGLLSKNAEDSRSGAGQYFTPRALVDCITQVMRPAAGEVIQDPATGTGGFLISADQYIRKSTSEKSYDRRKPTYQGVEIERGTYRICLMNMFLRGMTSEIILGDALTDDASALLPADLIIANPPFGSKSGSVRPTRRDFSFSSSNKQLEFLQHIYRGLKNGGRAAVVLPDNVLFDDGVGRQVRQELMSVCNLHTILRLPTGIFYAQGVKTNVLFFSKPRSRKKATSEVWVYDLRTSMPKLGKRVPLTLEHFAEFIREFGEDSMGGAPRNDGGAEGRFRVFSRQQIADGDDSLDLKWLVGPDEFDPDQVLVPDEILAAMVADLKLAAQELEDLQAVLSNRDGE